MNRSMHLRFIKLACTQNSTQTVSKLVLTVCDTLWQFVTLCDSLWQSVTVCDTFRQFVTVCDSLWQCVTVCDSLCYFVTVCETLWVFVRVCDSLWQLVTLYDSLWHFAKKFGTFWQFLRVCDIFIQTCVTVCNTLWSFVTVTFCDNLWQSLYLSVCGGGVRVPQEKEEGYGDCAPGVTGGQECSPTSLYDVRPTSSHSRSQWLQGLMGVIGRLHPITVCPPSLVRLWVWWTEQRQTTPDMILVMLAVTWYVWSMSCYHCYSHRSHCVSHGKT